MHRLPRAALAAPAALLLTLSLAACGGGGGDKSADDLKDDLSATFQDAGGLEEADADCMADVLVEEIGAEDLQDVDFDAEAPPEELQEEYLAAVGAAVDECDIAIGQLEG